MKQAMTGNWTSPGSQPGSQSPGIRPVSEDNLLIPHLPLMSKINK